MSDDKRKKLSQITILLTILLFCLICCFQFLFGPSSYSPKPEETSPSWSPDNRRLVYECYRTGPSEGGSVWNVGESTEYYQRVYTQEAADLCVSGPDEIKEVRITKERGGDWHPVWSPDGSQIAYLRQDGIYLIKLEKLSRRQLVPLQKIDPSSGYEPGRADVLTWSPDGRQLLFSGCLDSADYDVYVVDVHTGVIRNLTSHSHLHDRYPMWTLDGTTVVYYSTDASSWEHCRLNLDSTFYELKSMEVNGSGESVIDKSVHRYRSLSVSNSGRIAFIRDSRLHVMDLTGKFIQVAVEKDIGEPLVWSPNEEYLAYDGYKNVTILNVETDETIESPQIGAGIYVHIYGLVWSPDSQKVAIIATVSSGDFIEAKVARHIYIFDLSNRMLRPLIEEGGSP